MYIYIYTCVWELTHTIETFMNPQYFAFDGVHCCMQLGAPSSAKSASALGHPCADCEDPEVPPAAAHGPAGIAIPPTIWAGMPI